MASGDHIPEHETTISNLEGALRAVGLSEEEIQNAKHGKFAVLIVEPTTSTAKVDRLCAEIEEYRLEANRAKAQVEQQRATISDLQKANDRLVAELEKARAEVEQFKLEAEIAKADLRDARRDVEDAAGLFGIAAPKLGTDMAKVLAANVRFTQNAAKLRAERSELRTKVSELDRDVTSYRLELGGRVADQIINGSCSSYETKKDDPCISDLQTMLAIREAQMEAAQNEAVKQARDALRLSRELATAQREIEAFSERGLR